MTLIITGTARVTRHVKDDITGKYKTTVVRNVFVPQTPGVAIAVAQNTPLTNVQVDIDETVPPDGVATVSARQYMYTGHDAVGQPSPARGEVVEHLINSTPPGGMLLAPVITQP